MKCHYIPKEKFIYLYYSHGKITERGADVSVGHKMFALYSVLTKHVMPANTGFFRPHPRYMEIVQSRGIAHFSVQLELCR